MLYKIDSVAAASSGQGPSVLNNTGGLLLDFFWLFSLSKRVCMLMLKHIKVKISSVR